MIAADALAERIGQLPHGARARTLALLCIRVMMENENNLSTGQLFDIAESTVAFVRDSTRGEIAEFVAKIISFPEKDLRTTLATLCIEMLKQEQTTAERWENLILMLDRPKDQQNGP